MVATPRYGTLTFWNGVKHTNKDIYCSDVANAYVNMDGGDGASSSTPDNLILPSSCRLVDASIATGLADTTKWQIVVNGADTGDNLRHANHVNTLSMRTPINIPLRKGDVLRMIQKA